MGRFFKYALGTVLGLLFLSLIHGGAVHATEGDSWIDTQLETVAEAPVNDVPYITTVCPVTVVPIQVEGLPGLVEGCVFGEAGDTRMAMYLLNSSYTYAVAGVTDSTFIPVTNLCVYISRCVYSQSEDTVLLRMRISSTVVGHAMVKNFSDYLVLHNDGQRYYQFEYPDDFQFLKSGEYNLSTGPVGVSSNGRWAVIEVRTYGFIRIDMRTQEVRRILAPGANYGYGFDPTFELTISNDGRRVAISGQNAGFRVLEVTDDCGDTIAEGMTQSFSGSTIACPYIGLDPYGLFPGFLLANAPRFSTSGDSMSAYVRTQDRTLLVRMASSGGSVQPNPDVPGRYVAFGDSFTSGEGELSDLFYLPNTNTPTNRCHVGTRSYPYLLQSHWEVMTSNLACSGARTVEVQSTLKTAVNDATLRPAVVSLSVGGNDVGLVGKLSTCVQPGTCEWAEPERRIATAHEIKGLLQPLTTLMSQIRTEYAGTPLFVVGYPKIINDTANAPCGLVLSSLLNTQEREYMNQTIVYLNRILRAAAHYANIRFVDIEHAFEGERLCDDSSQAMNGIRYGDDIAPVPFIKTKFIGAESFHPTPYGHSLVAQAIAAQLGNTFIQDASCLECWFDESIVEIPSYWTAEAEENWSAIRQFTQMFMTTTQLVNDTKAAFEFIAGTFAPGQSVTLELHSDTIPLGTFTANEDGSLTGEIPLPDDVTGFHTVHALGESTTGESLDIYQTVFIDESVVSIAEPNVPVTGGGTSNAGGVALNTPVQSGSDSVQSLGAVAAEAPYEPMAISLAIPSSNSAEASKKSVLGASTSTTEAPKDAIEQANGYESILITYGVLAVMSALGIGCIYWYIRIKSKEVD